MAVMLIQSYAVAGPIYVCDAAPGDVLQVDILDLQPRYLPLTWRHSTLADNILTDCWTLQGLCMCKEPQLTKHGLEASGHCQTVTATKA